MPILSPGGSTRSADLSARHRALPHGYARAVSTLRLLGLLTLLAGLDVGAAIALKESALRRDPFLTALGIALLVGVAAVLLKAISQADLTLVSLGWIVMFQVAITGIDHVRYHVTPGVLQGCALVVAVAALIVAALAPAHERGEQPSPLQQIPIQPGPVLGEYTGSVITSQGDA